MYNSIVYIIAPDISPSVGALYHEHRSQFLLRVDGLFFCAANCGDYLWHLALALSPW